MATKKQTPIEKAYSMFGRGEWVAEAGKVKETRLIKELVEYCENLQQQNENFSAEHTRHLQESWKIESLENEKSRLEDRCSELQSFIDTVKEEIDSIFRSYN